MKYRIEEGEVKIPLSELNRLNDLFERNNEKAEMLERREEALEDRSKELDQKLADSTMVVIKKTESLAYLPYEKFTIVTINEACEELKGFRNEMFEEDLREANKKKNKHFSEMSVREFRKWKKEYNNQ